MKARIYEIKSSAAANAEVLRDEENEFVLECRVTFDLFVEHCSDV